MPCGRLPLVKHKLLLEISNYQLKHILNLNFMNLLWIK